MKSIFWLSILSIVVLVLAGCTFVSSTVQPTQGKQLLYQTILPATDTLTLTSTSTLAATETPSPTPTQTPLATLDSASVKETVQPLIKSPMNCTVPCFWGIIPGKSSIGEVRAFFSTLGFIPYEGTYPSSGTDFYTIAYESSIGRDSSVTFDILNNIVGDIEITPDIIQQKAGSPRDWIAYSPETLIKNYGKPSHVGFALDRQVYTTIVMVLYFDDANLIALYEGTNLVPGDPDSPRLCPLTAPFDHVRLWIGPSPLNPPLFPTVPLEKATLLTIDQFTRLMVGDRQKACFILNGMAFQ
jgi:hypothetical protein